MQRFVQIIEDDERFEFQPVDPSTGEQLGTTFIVSRVTSAEKKRRRQANTKAIKDSAGRIVEREIDWDAQASDILRAHVHGWRGVTNASGEDIPFDAELINRLPDTIQAQLVKSVQGTFAGPDKEDLGNSEITSSSEPGNRA